LRAACEVFSERGYDAATFQAIAIRADLTRPAINHYFSSKRVLYWQVVQETNDAVVTASIQRAQRESTLIGRVTAFVEAAREAAAFENRSTAAFLITVALESQRHPDLTREESDSIRVTRGFLSWAIDEAIERGELGEDTDAPALTETLVAILLGLGFYAGFVGSRQELDAVVDQLRQFLGSRLVRHPE
jgi:AcrR family transcriptional regulator